jgi:hypothetical protein
MGKRYRPSPRAIVRHFARTVPGSEGRVSSMVCTRGRDELYPTGSDGKIIYDDFEKASGAARELAKHGYGVQTPTPARAHSMATTT